MHVLTRGFKHKKREKQTHAQAKQVTQLLRGGRWPRPPMFELFGMAPQRTILGPMTNTRLEALIPSNMANDKDLIDLCIMGGGIVHWENNTPPMSMPTSRQDNYIEWEVCVQSLKPHCSNRWYLAHALTREILLHPTASWIYLQGYHECWHSEARSLLAVYDPGWSDTESLYASSWNVALGWEKSWWLFHCHTKEALTTRKRAIDGIDTNGAPDKQCAISIEFKLLMAHLAEGAPLVLKSFFLN